MRLLVRHEAGLSLSSFLRPVLEKITRDRLESRNEREPNFFDPTSATGDLHCWIDQDHTRPVRKYSGRNDSTLHRRNIFIQHDVATAEHGDYCTILITRRQSKH